MCLMNKPTCKVTKNTFFLQIFLQKKLSVFENDYPQLSHIDSVQASIWPVGPVSQ